MTQTREAMPSADASHPSRGPGQLEADRAMAATQDDGSHEAQATAVDTPGASTQTTSPPTVATGAAGR